jgi:hypothetical protein
MFVVQTLFLRRFLMMTVLVQFKLPDSVDRDEMERAFSSVAPMYYEIPRLIRKYFLLSEDCATAGGIYNSMQVR